MDLKILLILFLTKFSITYCQEDFIECEYRLYDWTYQCYLSVNNPNGYDGFDRIEGTHWPDQSDDDVKEIISFQYYDYISTNVPSIICNQFKNLEEIDLQRIKIQTIDENTLKNCKKLLKLILTYNEILMVPEDTFSSNFELQYINLGNNRITSLPEGIFRNQINLVSLVLGNNNFSNRFDNIFNPLINLKGLTIDANQVTHLKPEWFKSLVNLEMFSCNSNQVEEFPLGLFNQFQNLTWLYIERNNLRIIHADSFGIQPKLHTIHFTYNQIEAVEGRFFDNVLVRRMFAAFNVCVNRNVMDTAIRGAFKICIENYDKIEKISYKSEG